ncbi:MAG: 50S ribosomal protein L10 [Pyrinomonadaceae bacterium]
MKSREIKQNDLTALTESLATSKSAMVVSFTKLSVTKDQEFRSSVRAAGAKYQVVKNTLARIAVKGTQFEDATEHFKGVTAIAWTENDPVVLSKAISKFMKDNADIYTFKTGVVDGRLVDFAQLNTIANLPSKEELISKLLWVINSSAERLVTVINAVPRDLAVVIKMIGDSKPAGTAPAAEAKAEAPAAEVAVDVPAVEAAPAAEAVAEVVEETPAVEAAPAEAEVSADAPAEAVAEEAPAVAAAAEEAPAETTQEVVEEAPEAEAEEKAE